MNYNQGRDRRTVGYGQGNYRRDAYNGRNVKPVTIPQPKPIPEDYLAKAEKAMTEISGYKKDQQITTSKLRNLYSLAMSIYDKELRSTKATLSDDSEFQLKRMQMRVLYEYGRDQAVKTFVETTDLLSYLKGIGNSRKEYLTFAHYMEALVAYHRFLGVGGKR